MELIINNQKKQYDFQCISLQQLLDLEKPIHQKGIAVAVNQTVIPKEKWVEHFLNAGDAVLIITATQGG